MGGHDRRHGCGRRGNSRRLPGRTLFSGRSARPRLLAGCYAAALGSRGVDVDLSATLYVALFFLTAELAYWSLELSPGIQPAPGVVVRRVLFLAVGALAAVALAGLVLAAALEPLPQGLLVQALGVAGALVAMGLIAVLVRRSEPR